MKQQTFYFRSLSTLANVVLLFLLTLSIMGCAAIQPATAFVQDPGIVDRVQAVSFQPNDIKAAIELVRMNAANTAVYTKPGVGIVISWMQKGEQMFLFVLNPGGAWKVLPNGLLAGLNRITGMQDQLANDGWKPATVAPTLLLWIETAASAMTSVWMIPIAPSFDLQKWLNPQIQS